MPRPDDAKMYFSRSGNGSVTAVRLWACLTILLWCAAPARAGEPVVDLDPGDSTGLRPNFTARFIEKGIPAPVSGPDAVITVAGEPVVTGMSIAISNVQAFDHLDVEIVDETVRVDYFNGVFHATGTASPGVYENILRHVRYHNESPHPAPVTREIRIEVRNPDGVSAPVVSEVRITALNDPPVNTIPESQMTPKGVPVVFSRERGNAISVADPDLGDNPLQLFLTTDRGTLALSQTAGIDIQGNHTPSVVVSGTIDAVNDALEGLVYTPQEGWQGRARLEVLSDDQGYSGSPGPLTDLDEITIAVITTVDPEPPVADAGPDQVADEYTRITLDGGSSASALSGDLAYAWRQIAGPSARMAAASGETVTCLTPAVTAGSEELTFELAVTDALGRTASDTVGVTVHDTGAPHGHGVEGEGISLPLPAEAENAQPGRIWIQVEGAPAALSDPGMISPTLVAPAVGGEGDVLVFRRVPAEDMTAPPDFRSVLTISDNGIAGFPEGVLTFRPLTGTRMGIRVTGGELVWLENIDPQGILDMRGRPGAFLYGLLRMRIRVPEPGADVMVGIHLPNAAAGGFGWFKYDPAGGWFSYPDAIFSPLRDQILIQMRDGGAGDADRTVNGYIDDPSGLAVALPVEDGGADGGSDTGGCFFVAVFPSI